MSSPIDYIEVVRAVARMSKNPKKKVGAIILGPRLEIRSTGRNGLPRGVNELEGRYNHPLKRKWVCHAEENAIVQAAKSGVSVDGCTIVVSPLHPCEVCARMIVNSGIKKVVAAHPSSDVHSSEWAESAKIASEMFAESGVEVHYL